MNSVIIEIYKIPLKNKYENLQDLKIKDELLHREICIYAKQLQREGWEVWLIEDNILVSEIGYFAVFYK